MLTDVEVDMANKVIRFGCQKLLLTAHAAIARAELMMEERRVSELKREYESPKRLALVVMGHARILVLKMVRMCAY